MAASVLRSSSIIRNFYSRNAHLAQNALDGPSYRMPFRWNTSASTDQKAEGSTPESGQDSPPPVDESLTKLQDENKSLLERVKEVDDKYKRALAESENVRVRLSKQIEEAKVYGIQSFCKDLLDVADVLQTAVTSVPEEVVKNGDEHFKNLFQGVQMTDKHLQSVFRRHGLLQINPLGEKFNPNEHQALFESLMEGKEPGTVAVVQKIGYKLKDRTVRPAMVGVVKRC